MKTKKNLKEGKWNHDAVGRSGPISVYRDGTESVKFYMENDKWMYSVTKPNGDQAPGFSFGKSAGTVDAQYSKYFDNGNIRGMTVAAKKILKEGMIHESKQIKEFSDQNSLLYQSLMKLFLKERKKLKSFKLQHGIKTDDEYDYDGVSDTFATAVSHLFNQPRRSGDLEIDLVNDMDYYLTCSVDELKKYILTLIKNYKNMNESKQFKFADIAKKILKENSYDNFLTSYGKDIQKALEKIKSISKAIESSESHQVPNAGDDMYPEELVDEIQNKLKVYDKGVEETIDHFINIADYLTVRDIADAAHKNFSRYGTEMQMFLYAIDDYYDVVSNYDGQIANYLNVDDED